MVQGDGGQTPHSMLPVTKHGERVSILVTCAEVCVAAVLGVAEVRQRQGEDLFHLEETSKKDQSSFRLENIC